jgi:hypothetical protein
LTISDHFISAKGVATYYFSEPVIQNMETMEILKEIGVVSVTHSGSSSEQQAMEWNFLEVTSKLISIQLTFSDPEAIGMN